MTLFSLYEQKLIRLTDDQGNLFTGIAETLPAEFCMHEYGKEEEAIRLGAYTIYRSQIQKVEILPTYEEAVRDGKTYRRFYRLERIERVEKYEKLYDEASVSRDPEKLALLEAYYTSGQWREDYEADERGELPHDLKRGVLSQDALYDLLEGAEL